MRTFRLMSCLILLSLVTFAVTPAVAAVLMLKNGQSVEGTFLSASQSEIHIQVGSQKLTFAITEVAQLVFDPAAVPRTSGSAGDSFASAAKDVLQQLKALESVVETGVIYQDYLKRCGDLKSAVDVFLDEHADSRVLLFNQHVRDAMGYFGAAADAWSQKISRSFEGYDRLATNPYCIKCPALERAVATQAASLRKMMAGVSKTTRDGMSISVMGTAPLWECASAAIADAETALSNK